MKRTHGTPMERFLRHLEKNGPIPERRPDLGPCWVWRGFVQSTGYAKMRSGGAGSPSVYVHRFAYAELVGEIPDGLDIDHLCAVRHCANPEHLEAVTSKENAKRRSASSHCQRGHEMSGGNLGTHPSSGTRFCRECRRTAHRENQRRKARLKREGAA